MIGYVINIALDGEHYAKIHLPSHIGEQSAKKAAADFATKFPVEEGYEVTMHYWQNSGRSVQF